MPLLSLGLNDEQQKDSTSLQEVGENSSGERSLDSTEWRNDSADAAKISSLPPAIEELRRKLSGDATDAAHNHTRQAGLEARAHVGSTNPDHIPTFATFKFGYLP